MPASTMRLRLSTQDASEGNAEASLPGESIGGYMSTTALVSGSLANLLPSVTEAEAAVGKTIYRCLFLYNSDPANDWLGVKLWLASRSSYGGDVSIGLDPAGISAAGASSPQAEEPADGFTEPDGVTFSRPSTEASALVVGDMGPETCAALWVRHRIVANPPATALARAILSIYGETQP